MSSVVSGIGGLVGGLLGGNSAPSAPNVNVYQPGGTSTADSQLQALLTQGYNTVNGSSNPYTQYSPQFANLYNQIYGSPYQAGAQTSANTGGASYGTVGTAGVGNSSAISGAVNPLLSGASTVLNQGLDPQTALYNQTLQNTNDAANVANAQYGLTGQQAAGNVNQADTNFNIDWQNQQLSRALSALSGAGTAVGAAGTAGTAAQNVGSAGAGAQVQAGSIPYQQQVSGVSNQSTALQQYIASLLGPQTSTQTTIGDLSSYLGQGIGASTAGQNAALQAYQAQLQGATSGAIGGAGLGSLLGNGFSSAGGFNFLNPSTSALFSSGSAAGSAAAVAV
jgi:hypothetical protein